MSLLEAKLRTVHTGDRYIGKSVQQLTIDSSMIKRGRPLKLVWLYLLSRYTVEVVRYTCSSLYNTIRVKRSGFQEQTYKVTRRENESKVSVPIYTYIFFYPEEKGSIRNFQPDVAKTFFKSIYSISLLLFQTISYPSFPCSVYLNLWKYKRYVEIVFFWM